MSRKEKANVAGGNAEWSFKINYMAYNKALETEMVLAATFENILFIKIRTRNLAETLFFFRISNFTSRKARQARNKFHHYTLTT